jgi:hypothetical protein
MCYNRDWGGGGAKKENLKHYAICYNLSRNRPVIVDQTQFVQTLIQNKHTNFNLNSLWS